jgi:hypothetical protein
MLEECEILQSL